MKRRGKLDLDKEQKIGIFALGSNSVGVFLVLVVEVDTLSRVNTR